MIVPMREAFAFNPEAAKESGQNEHRQQLEERWRSPQDFSIEDVPREVADEFIAEKKAELAKEKEELARRQAELDARYAALDAVAGFTEEEEKWFAGGEAAGRKLALQDSWEAHGSLDVEEVPAAEKVAFADDRLRQLKYLAGTEKFRFSDGLADRIARLELLRDQYAKEAEQEKGTDAA